jgi:hypothetical protein
MNMKLTFRLAAATLLLALGGCASLSEEECRFSDWYDLGYRDGRQGRPADRISEHAQACGEHGLRPDRERYLSGHQDGIGSYCTLHNGLKVGENGGAYYNVCSPDNEQDFLRGYSVGHALHRVRGRLNSIESEIYALDGRISDKETEKKELPALVYQRVQLEGERGEAREQLRNLEAEAYSLESVGG